MILNYSILLYINCTTLLYFCILFHSHECHNIWPITVIIISARHLFRWLCNQNSHPSWLVDYNVEWLLIKEALFKQWTELFYAVAATIFFINAPELWASSMQAQQVQQQAQHQQITGANVILKMNDIQQLSTVGRCH